MTKKENTDPHFGFLSVVKLGTSTFVGGYLLLNSMGRPTEFHCSEAVKPTRAQEILYGASLYGYLHSDLLGKTLIDSAKKTPDLLFVDSRHALDLQKQIQISVALVNEESEDQQKEIAIAENTIELGTESKLSLDSIQAKWPQLLHWDLQEPFQRIHDAINETQKAA